VIKTFADKETEKLFHGRRSKVVPAQVRERAEAKLRVLDAASDIRDLEAPPSNYLKKLSGDREGQWSIRMNKQYRICFDFEGGDAYGVEIVDYH
jgi:toxin HigB-1